jgi:hypothetical protein
MNIKKNLIILLAVLITAFSLLLSFGGKRLYDAVNEIDTLKSELSDIEIRIEEEDRELKSYNILINNSNTLLSTVYYGTAELIEGGPDGTFTAFSMFYKDDFYLVTAGHCIEYNDLKYTNFKFKSNDSGTYIYPRLLDYNSDYKNNNDYAIFHSHLVRKGLLVYEEDKEPKYVLGNTEKRINFFKRFDTAAGGESGSPILNSKCRLVGVVIKNNDNYTPIEVVTDAIDKLIETTMEPEKSL